MRYRPRPLPIKKRLLEAQIVKVSKEHPTPGYKKVTGLMGSMGYEVNKKLVQRVRREEGLQVPPPKPRQRRQGLPRTTAANKATLTLGNYLIASGPKVGVQPIPTPVGNMRS